MPLAHITAWRVMENKIAIKFNLERRGVANSLLCCFCWEKEKTTSHLFFECKITWLVWSLCYAWVGLKSAYHLEPTSHFLHSNLFGAPTIINLVFENIWIALVSEIWWHWNKHIFKGRVIDHFEIFPWHSCRSGLGLLPKFLQLVFIFQIGVLIFWFVCFQLKISDLS